MMASPFYVSGYSYKGGVGRSTALANIACLLAEDSSHPQKVLVWDFDLEAPGMHRLFPAKGTNRTGFVDLAFEYASSGQMPDVSEFVYESIVEGIDVLSAGIVGSSYCSKLSQIDWMQFFDDDPSSYGEFFGNLCNWIRKEEYDYVLVDSRTGLSDIAGICTQVLPNILLTFFRLTEQNLDGISHFVPAAKTQLKSRNKRVKLMPIVSPVLPHSSDVLNRLKKSAEQVFGTNELNYIRFDQDLVVEEKLFCRKEIQADFWPKPIVLEDYSNITEAIRRQNSNDTSTQERKLNNRMSNEDFASARTILTSLLERRPGMKTYWRHLQTVCERTELKYGDAIVEKIRSANESNSYLKVWEASVSAEKAPTPHCEEISRAKDLLQAAIGESSDRDSGRLWMMLAEIASCTGDLPGRTAALEECVKRSPNNFQLKLRLANQYVRQGRDYFILARNLLEKHAGVIQRPVLVYLLSYFGDEKLAEKAFENLRQRTSDWSGLGFMKVVQTHSHILLGRKDKANEIVDSAIKRQAGAETLNLAECLVCLERYQEAIDLLNEKKETAPFAENLSGLTLLAEYLNGSEPKRSDLINADTWRTWHSWNFNELLFFRARCFRENIAICDKMEVIEEIMQHASFNNPRTEGSIFWRKVSRQPSRVFQVEIAHNN